MSVLDGLAAPPLRRQPEFLKFWAGQTISVFGDAVTMLALPLVAVLTLDATAAQMGLLTAAGLAPHLLLSLFAGVLVDRQARRRRFLVVADVGRAVLLASIPLAAVLDALTLEQLFVVSFAVGALTVLFDVSYSSLFYLIVPTRDVVEANSKLSVSRSASYMGGPPLAGALVELLTAPFALAADAVSFLASAFFVSRIRVEERPIERDGNGIRAQLAAGFRFFFGHPILRAGLLCTATVNFFNFAFHAIFVLFATEELIGPTYMLGAILFPAPLVLVPLADGPLWLIAVLLFASEFGAGVGVMLFDVSGNSLQLVLTPQRLRARAAGSHRTINYGVRPLGALLGGFLGSAIGLRPTLWIATVGAAVGILWLVFSPVPAIRDLPPQAE